VIGGPFDPSEVGGVEEALPASHLENGFSAQRESAMSSLRKALSLPAIAVALGMFFTLLAVLCLPAFAQNRPCADDVAKFCKGVKGRPGQIMQCLKEHQSELSPGCQNQVQVMEARMKAMSDACRSDMQRFCQHVSPSDGRIAKCLKQHESELAPTCKAELAQARSLRRSTR
jgi:hypothetical protein